MSVQAIAWVLDDAPDLPSHLVSTLIALANHADKHGRGSWPGQATIAWYTRKSDRQIRKDLVQLAELGFIRLGDQRLVQHLPADERPVVYDLAMDLPKRTRVVAEKTAPKQRDRNHSSARTSRGTGTTVPPQSGKGPEPQFLPLDTGTGTPVPDERTNGPELQFQRDRNSSSYKPSLNQKPLPPQHRGPVTAIAAVLGEDEDEAQRVFDYIVDTLKPTAPSAYIASLISTGDIKAHAARSRATRTTPPPAEPHRDAHDFVPIDQLNNPGCAVCGMPRANARHRRHLTVVGETA